MPFFIVIMETIDPAKDAEILDEHKAYLQHHIDVGNIYAKGPFTDHSGGLIILKTDTLESARTIVEHDPVSVNNTRKITLKQWKSSFPDHY